MKSNLSEKLVWSACGAILSLLLAVIIGGVYQITPPSGPVDTAYKINRYTGKVWLVKTYAKPLAQGQIRVIAAREAEVEATRELSEEEQQTFLTRSQTIPIEAPRRR